MQNNVLGPYAAATAMAMVSQALPLDLETKDEPNPDPDTREVKDALASLLTTVKEHKDSVTEEIAELKKKGGSDPLLDERIKKLDESIVSQQKTIDDLRLREQRPMIEEPDGTKRQLTDVEVKHNEAWQAYMRKGDDSGYTALRDMDTKSLSVGTDPDGGYLAPPEMDRTINRVVTEISPIRAIADVRSISGNSLKKMVNRAGATSGWVGETGARPETGTPDLSALDFPTMELYAMPAVTQTLLDDSQINLEQWLAGEVQTEFAFQEGSAFVNGDGTNKPRGILAYPKVANSSYAWGSTGYIATGASGAFKTTATGDDENNLIDLVYSLKAAYRQGARFVMNRNTLALIRKMRDGDGRSFWQPSLSQGQPQTILGYPVTEAEDMPDIAADTFSVAFGDFRRGYMIVDRIGIRVLRDPFSSKPYILFYTTKRVGGGIQMFEALKLLKFGTS